MSADPKAIDEEEGEDVYPSSLADAFRILEGWSNELIRRCNPLLSLFSDEALMDLDGERYARLLRDTIDRYYTGAEAFAAKNMLANLEPYLAHLAERRARKERAWRRAYA